MNNYVFDSRGYNQSQDKERFSKVTNAIKKAYEDYGNNWKRQSVCSHLDEDIANGKQCIKCGRVVIKKRGFKWFFRAPEFWTNGTPYLIKKIKEEKK